MIGKKIVFVALLLILTSVVSGACQPVQPLTGLATPGSISGDLDFAAPDWGLEHGWFHFNVLAPEEEGAAPSGWVRWVELNEKQELRYVMADARCVAFSEDGKSAVLTVQITDRRGWGDGQAEQWLTLWLHDGGAPGAGADAFATPFWPPQDEDPGCAYVDQGGDIVPSMGGDLKIHRGAEMASTQPVVAPETAHRTVAGEFGFPSPKEWGVDLWITQDFDVLEVNSENHTAEGTINWGVYDVLQRQWKLVKADAKYVFFDESGQRALVMAAITEKSGEGEGEPGEYASFWVHDGGAQDRFG
ncbi:MAG: hypothetical protein R6W76_11050, partial [Caldilinea sp.]